MSALLEQYFQTVVVDKINEIISERFKEMKVELDAKFFEFRIEMESLKKKVSDSGQEICGKMYNDIKEMLKENGKKAEAAKMPVEVKVPIAAKKTVAKKAPVKKTVAKKAPTKRTAKK